MLQNRYSKLWFVQYQRIAITYQLWLPKGTIDQPQSIQNGVGKITRPHEPLERWDNIAEVRHRRVAIDVFKCLNGLSPEQFTQYFNRYQHGKDTSGNNSCFVLPPVRTETGGRKFAFLGAQIFNKFPKDSGNEESLIRFKHKLSLTSC